MNSQLKKSLSPLLLWSLGVGYVISGLYFGWNLGLAYGGTYGMGAATLIVIIMYICFCYSYCELACAIPKAGGGFDYSTRAFGANIGFITGLAQFCLVIFTVPAIAIGIGTNINLAFPNVSIIGSSICVFVLFTLINIAGVKIASTFEMLVTILAIAGILIFSGVAFPHFSIANFTKNASIGGVSGIFGALPFAIWFFLGIECLANVAEESENPQRDLSTGFGTSMFTLIVLTVLIFVATIGLGGWEKVVFDKQNNQSDSPLPLVLSAILGKSNWFYPFSIGLGILGLVASFNGGILAGGRLTMEMGRVGFAPKFLANIHQKYNTPTIALLINMLIGILILFMGNTSEIIILAVFGVLSLYIISMLSLIKLRKTEPNLIRPFKTPFYPFLPIIALVICTICLLAIVFYNQHLTLIFLGILIFGFAIYRLLMKIAN